MFLLDTDVISRTSPLSVRPIAVHDWLAAHEHESFISVLTLSELSRGMVLLRLKGSLRRAKLLEAWILEVEGTVSGRLLDVDRNIGWRAGELLATAEAAGHRPGFVDACLAATAAERRLTVVTFNARHFDALGVPHRRPALDSDPG